MDILEKLLALFKADSTLANNFEQFSDYIPDDIPSNGSFPLLAIDWAGDTHNSDALNSRKVKSLFHILVAVDEWEQVTARKQLVELSGIVTDFLSKKTTMGQEGYWLCGKLAEQGQNVRVGKFQSSGSSLRLNDSGFVYGTLILWEAEFRKTRQT